LSVKKCIHETKIAGIFIACENRHAIILICRNIQMTSIGADQNVIWVLQPNHWALSIPQGIAEVQVP